MSHINNSNKLATFSNLPNELLLETCSWLGGRDLAMVRQSCQYFSSGELTEIAANKSLERMGGLPSPLFAEVVPSVVKPEQILEMPHSIVSKFLSADGCSVDVATPENSSILVRCFMKESKAIRSRDKAQCASGQADTTCEETAARGPVHDTPNSLSNGMVQTLKDLTGLEGWRIRLWWENRRALHFYRKNIKYSGSACACPSKAASFQKLFKGVRIDSRSPDVCSKGIALFKILLHGGSMETDRPTHAIVSDLNIFSHSKLALERRQSLQNTKKLIIVRSEWVDASVVAGKLLPEGPFQIHI